MAAGFSQSKGHKREQGRSRNDFYDLISEATLCHFYNVLLSTQIGSLQCERGPPKGINIRRSTWRLATIAFIIPKRS